jgi:hypothetical protein
MVESAERRKKIERRRMAYIVAYAVNAPKELDKLVPDEKVPEQRPARETGSIEPTGWDYEEWWD